MLGSRRTLSNFQKKELKEHLKIIERKITNEAKKGLEEEVKKSKDDELSTIKISGVPPKDLLFAMNKYAPGDEFPKTTFWSKVWESVSAVTLLSAALALIFGIIGGLQGSNSDLGAGFLDIAKIPFKLRLYHT